ncbi:NCS2 family permease [Clostridium sp.]|jgi:adenine/guanine/hypoxanthine permease|uniref:NCS2 family permease n=1 Tax=Clostridium sp. TaxID=1506 RepID=UPI003A5BC538
MKDLLERKFKLSKYNTKIRIELIAGLTTFFTMAYVLAVVPNTLGAAGFNRSNTLTAEILLIILTTVWMALYTNRPFALAPGLGSIAIVAAMVGNEGIPTDIAAGIIFIGGLLFVIISFAGVRESIVKMIPVSLKYSITASIGIFIALIGAKSCGLITVNAAKKSLSFGDLTSPAVILAVIGFVLMLIFKARNVTAGMIIVIMITTLIGIPMGVTKIPSTFVMLPKGLGENFFNIDILGAFKLKYIPFVFALFIPDFFSTLGTVLGVGAQAGYLDEDGNLPGIDKCFYVDSISACIGSFFVMPTMVTYFESSAGVEAGGKTGLTVIFTSIFFATMLFFTPIALMIPSSATAPVLIFMGVNMLSKLRYVNYNDITEYIPALLCVVFTIFANNIANGICVALPAYIILKISSGKTKEISKPMYIIAIICILYFYSILKL